MKKIIIICLPVLILLNTCAQATPISSSTDEVIRNLQLAVNSKDFSIIEPYLAPNYQYQTMSGQMAKNVLSQVITQYPKIDSITVISTLEEGTKKTLIVVIHNINESSTSKIELDKNNDILRADIAEIAIHGQSSSNENPTAVDTKGTFKFPFALSETGHIVVEANIEGVKGNFIVDSGSGGSLVLNDQFQTYNSVPNVQIPVGVNGQVKESGKTKIKRFDWGKLTFTEMEVATANLNHLGENMGVDNFAGTIGYQILRNYVVEFDYDNKQITLWNSSESFNTHYSNTQMSSLPLKMVVHLPVIEATFGDQTLRFGIDCAAQSNLLLNRFEKSLSLHLTNKRIEILGGAENNYMKVTKGQLSGITILDRRYDMDFIFGNLFGGQHEVTMMDGLLGYPLLSSQKTAINYIDNKLHFLN